MLDQLHLDAGRGERGAVDRIHPMLDRRRNPHPNADVAAHEHHAGVGRRGEQLDHALAAAPIARPRDLDGTTHGSL
jgi:hypothetical protein